METNTLPKVSFDAPETKCCPRFDPGPWQGATVTLDRKTFVKGTTFNVLHMPLTFGAMMKKVWKQIEDAGANSPDQFALLSYDVSPWKGEHLFWVTKDVPGAETISLSGTFRTEVFEGPFRNIPDWEKKLHDEFGASGTDVKKIYWYYTTCPKCAKQYGKNYCIAFVQIR